MGDAVKGIIGLFRPPKAPKSSDVGRSSREAAQGVEDEQRQTRRQRSRLFETEGGAAGEEVELGGVSRRNTLLGN